MYRGVFFIDSARETDYKLERELQHIMRGLFQRLALFTFFCLVAVGVAAYLKSPAGIPAALQKREQVRGIEQQNRMLREEIVRRKERVHRLETDQVYRDREVRERYNLQKPNEQTIYLQNNPPAAH
jgi:cell division protein FtsB